VSAWLEEIRPEFRAEFFDADADMLCGNGNVDLAQALLAGRARYCVERRDLFFLDGWSEAQSGAD
jgi:hypothetical protein